MQRAPLCLSAGAGQRECQSGQVMEPHQLLFAVHHQLEQVQVDVGVGLGVDPVVKARRAGGSAGSDIVAGNDTDA